MAVGANSYGTVAKVEARVGDLVVGRVFGTGTIPTKVHVELLIDDVASRINMELRAQGYTVPVANTGSDVEAYAYLQYANSAGAAALVLNILPGVVLDPDSEDENMNRRVSLWAELKAALQYIKHGDLPATRTVTTEVTKAWSGSQQDNDGNVTAPAFSKERTSWPGVW